APAAPGRLLVRDLVDGLAAGDHHQDLPQVVAVAQPREPTLLGAAAEAVKGAQRDVLLVGHAPLDLAQFRARQAHQAAEVPLPQRLGGGAVPLLELFEPERDVAGGRHKLSPLFTGATASASVYRTHPVGRTPLWPRCGGRATASRGNPF